MTKETMKDKEKLVYCLTSSTIGCLKNISNKPEELTVEQYRRLEALYREILHISNKVTLNYDDGFKG